MRHSDILRVIVPVLALVASCGRQKPSSDEQGGERLEPTLGSRLSTGLHLDPAAPITPVGELALTMRLAPEGDRVVLSLSGYTMQGLQVVDVATGRVLQEIVQPAAFVGLVFSPDGKTLYASGGNQDVVYRYDWSQGRATLRDSLIVGRKAGRSGTRYPSGVAVSPDGSLLYVAENLDDSLAVFDVTTGKLTQRLPVERYPYDVVVGKNGAVYVSGWGSNAVSVFAQDGRSLRADGRVTVARHPSALLLNASGTRLFIASGSTDQVAVLDTKTRHVVTRLADPPPAGPHEGATPDGLALSADGSRLFVAEADANAIAVFDLTPQTSSVAAAGGNDKLSGRIPAGWYTTAVMPVGNTLLVVNGKGRGSGPNITGPQPPTALVNQARGRTHILGTLVGGMMRIPLDQTSGEPLATLSKRVAAANGWTDQSRSFRYPPFEHVIYVIKENRTYDQVLGDDKHGDGDSSLMFFGPGVSPNHHALADRFGLFDRFFVNAEVSADGHNWSTAAYASDYLDKTVQSNYSARRGPYDYEGSNRGVVPDDDVNEPSSGYLWNLAEKTGLTLRNYGEFVVPSTSAKDAGNAKRDKEDDDDQLPPGYRADKPFLYSNTNPWYPGFDLAIKDQHRADLWIGEFRDYVRTGKMPALEIVRLPNDHTSGAQAGRPTPRAAFADNDLALGRIVEALSNSPFWKNTAVFVLEDDAQNGPDHVDAHRSPLLVISAYSHAGTVHRFANTTDVLRTIEEILGLESLSQFDYFGRPLRDIWTSSPDLTPYAALTPTQSLNELNPAGTRGAAESANLNLRVEDAIDDNVFNRILWRAIKGDAVPYPGTVRASSRDLKIDP